MFYVGTRITYVSVAGLETYGRGFWKLEQLQNPWLVYFKFFAFTDARFVSVFGQFFMGNPPWAASYFAERNFKKTDRERKLGPQSSAQRAAEACVERSAQSLNNSLETRTALRLGLKANSARAARWINRSPEGKTKERAATLVPG